VTATPTIAFLGPAGTYSEEALLAAVGDGARPEPRATIREAIMAVQEGSADEAFVPIENSLEGGVTTTLDALAGEAENLRIVAEAVHPIRHHLLAGRALELAEVERVLSHPQATAQCSQFLRERLGGAEIVAATSTADAARTVGSGAEPWAALGSLRSAELYGCTVLAENVGDRADNVTRFVRLARAGGADARGAATKTSVVFWGFSDESPGALVAILSEFADRGINLTKIESRPRRVRLGHYMFFADLAGAEHDAEVAAALDGVRGRVETLRVLGSYAAARTG
jgi:prephenate dehydratase